MKEEDKEIKNELLPSISGLFSSTSIQKDTGNSTDRIKYSSYKPINRPLAATAASSVIASDLTASTSNDSDLNTQTTSKKGKLEHKKREDKKNHKKRKKEKEKHHRRHREKEEEDKNKSSHRQDYAKLYPKATFIEDTPLKANQAFRVDRKCDPNNISYDSLYINQIPSYWRPKQSYEDSNEPKKRKPRVQRYFGKKAKLEKNFTQMAKDVTHSTSMKNLAFFIPLSVDEKEKRDDDFYNTVFDPGTVAYSRGEGKNAESKEDKSLAKPFDDTISYFEQQVLFERIKKFNRFLNENPTQVSKWIEFVRLQSQMQVQQLGHSSETVTQSWIVDRQMSILEKALKHNPGNFELLMERLQVQQNSLDSHQLNEQWKQLVFRFPNQINVWFRYFEFVISNVSFFSITKLSQLFQQCIVKLIQLQQGQMKSHQASVDVGESMIKMVFLYTIILDSAGYAERSVAIWQALIEFNLFVPTNLGSNVSLDDLKDYFEPFWESGASRFGESNAQGWSEVMKNRVLDTSSIQSFHQEEIQLNKTEDRLIKSLDEDQPLAKSWLQLELTRQSFCWIPVKPSLGEECDDSVRAVQFDEIKSALFTLESVDDKLLLLNYFLRYLKAMPTENYLDVMSIMDIGLNPLSDEDLQNTCRLKDYSFRRDQFRFIRNVFDQSIRIYANNPNAVRTLTLQLFEFLSTTQLTFDSAEMRKVMKNELKQQRNRNDLDLWHAFCRFEQKFSSLMDALKIFEQVLSPFIVQGLPNQAQNVSRFVRLALQIESPAKFAFTSRLESIPVECCQSLVRVICSFANQKHYPKLEEINATTLMRTFHTFNVQTSSYDDLDLLFIEGVFFTILQANATHFPIHTSDKTMSSKIQQVVQRLNSITQNINQSSDEKQKKNQLFNVFKTLLEIQLLNFRCHLCSLQPIKQSLDKAMQCLPIEPMFLELFVRLELGSALSFKARRYVTHLYELGSASHAYQWIYVILYELKRLERLHHGEQEWAILQGNLSTINGGLYSVGVSNRMRAFFEHALRSTECVLLWRMYIAFEISQSDVNRAKSVFYRALQRCPWSKNLYLDAINTFSAAQSTQSNDDLTPEKVPGQLEELVSLMQEKEIRVRTLLEELQMLIEHRADLLVGDEID